MCPRHFISVTTPTDVPVLKGVLFSGVSARELRWESLAVSLFKNQTAAGAEKETKSPLSPPDSMFARRIAASSHLTANSIQFHTPKRGI